MSQLHPSQIPLAAAYLSDIVHKTPVLTSTSLNKRVGCDVYLKCENFQRVGAFKFRGAYNAISRLSEQQKQAGVITHSSGNHAQGVALSAQLLGIKATIVMPEDAPPVKKAATHGYGAEVVTCAAIDREKVAGALADEHGYTLIHSYNDDHLILGQGTAAYELFQEVGPLDALFGPVGGGGLISGSALAAAAISPDCRVIGVEPEIAADANRSWREGRIYQLPAVPDTIGDGLRLRAIGEKNLAIMRQYVADMTTATEAEILETLEFIWTRLKIIVEPSSAVALAPLLMGHYTLPGKRVGVILSGGNVNIPACGFFHRPVTVTTPEVPSEPISPSPPQPSILVLDSFTPQDLTPLSEVALIDIQPDLNEEEILDQIGRYQALIVGPDRRVTEAMLSYGDNLRVIGVVSSWLHRVDVSTARAHGIQVCYAPGSGAVRIAEHTMSRLLALTTQFTDGRLAGKTLGLIGFGRVAEQVARRAAAFDMRIIVNQPRLTPQLAIAAGVQATDLVDLLQEADFVSLHVPFKAETRTIIGARELKHMKATACLINTGHTDLIDETALLTALQHSHISAAALSTLPDDISLGPVNTAVRQHPHVIVSPHITTILQSQQQDMAHNVAQQVTHILNAPQPNQALPLQLVSADLVLPHEGIDEKRVSRLMKSLDTKGQLINPPVTTYWNGRYIVLDGATRSTALKRLGYNYLIVQVAQADDPGSFELHTWYHVISSQESFTSLTEHLQSIKGLKLTSLSTDEMSHAFADNKALCYFLNAQGEAILASVTTEADRLTVMNHIVTHYNAWGDVERTLLTDLSRLQAQFPHMTAVAVFPQFKPQAVFEAAAQGKLLPAGLTRFVIPGRILRLNADLARLKQEEPLAHKQAWFENFLADKLARSRLRYYQEPVILLDE